MWLCLPDRCHPCKAFYRPADTLSDQRYYVNRNDRSLNLIIHININIMEFKPTIVSFLCNWCSYTGADLAGTSRMKYSSDIRIIRVMCSGRVDPTFVLSAFEEGADGVMICGCHPGDCHYQKGNYYTRRRYKTINSVFESLHLDAERIFLSWVSASEGVKYARVTKEFSDKITSIGPNPVKKEIFL